MASEKVRILQKIHALTKKWFWGRDELMQLKEHLRALAHSDGYYASRSWEEEDYGLEEIGRLESPEAVSLLVAIAKKHGGTIAYTQVCNVLVSMRHPAAIHGLKELARSGESYEREVAIEALRNLGIRK